MFFLLSSLLSTLYILLLIFYLFSVYRKSHLQYDICNLNFYLCFLEFDEDFTMPHDENELIDDRENQN